MYNDTNAFIQSDKPGRYRRLECEVARLCDQRRHHRWRPVTTDGDQRRQLPMAKTAPSSTDLTTHGSDDAPYVSRERSSVPRLASSNRRTKPPHPTAHSPQPHTAPLSRWKQRQPWLGSCQPRSTLGHSQDQDPRRLAKDRYESPSRFGRGGAGRLRQLHT
jgi:hypothetical protein